jgi:hypothetical protein
MVKQGIFRSLVWLPDVDFETSGTTEPRIKIIALQAHALLASVHHKLRVSGNECKERPRGSFRQAI